MHMGDMGWGKGNSEHIRFRSDSMRWTSEHGRRRPCSDRAKRGPKDRAESGTPTTRRSASRICHHARVRRDHDALSFFFSSFPFTKTGREKKRKNMTKKEGEDEQERKRVLCCRGLRSGQKKTGLDLLHNLSQVRRRASYSADLFFPFLWVPWLRPFPPTILYAFDLMQCDTRLETTTWPCKSNQIK